MSTRTLLFAWVMLAGLALGATAVPIDVTTLGVIPNDGNDDAVAIRNALVNNPVLYFPPGVYKLSSTVYVPSNRTLYGAGMDQTMFLMATDNDAFRIEGVHDVFLSDFGIDYSAYDDSFNEAIFVYPSPNTGVISRRVQLNQIRVLNRRSRSSAFFFNKVSDCAVRHCEAINNTRWIWAAPDGRASYDPPEAWQVYGFGITFSRSDKVVAEHNKIYETEEHAALIKEKRLPYYLRYFQASAIQVASCTDALIQYNWVRYTGQGIDSNGTKGALIRGNYLENCHSHGMKFAHASSQQRLVGNYVKYAGLVGIPFAPGGTGEDGTNHCTAEDNVFVGTGKGIGAGWWNPNGTADYPAPIFFDIPADPSGRSHDNLIRNNVAYENDRLTTNPAAIGRFVVIRTGAAYNITQVNNLLLPGPAPTPAPVPYPAPVGLPLSQINTTVHTTDTLSRLSDGQLRTGALLTQGTATADSRWSFMLDLETTTRTISSIALYGNYAYLADEAAPGGLIQVEASDTVLGPFTLVGAREFGHDPATNPFTGGKGKRILLQPTTGRYLRISGGPWRDSFTNRLIISEVVIDPPVVLDDYVPVHNPDVALPNPAGIPQQSVWNAGIGYEDEQLGFNAVDGSLRTGIEPLRAVTLMLDIAPNQSGVRQIVDSLNCLAATTETSRLPYTGILRGSISDTPGDMNLVLNAFTVAAQGNAVSIPTNSAAPRRYLQLTVQTLQDGGTADARLKLAEITATAHDATKTAARHADLFR